MLSLAKKIQLEIHLVLTPMFSPLQLFQLPVFGPPRPWFILALAKWMNSYTTWDDVHFILPMVFHFVNEGFPSFGWYPESIVIPRDFLAAKFDHRNRHQLQGSKFFLFPDGRVERKVPWALPLQHFLSNQKKLLCFDPSKTWWLVEFLSFRFVIVCLSIHDTWNWCLYFFLKPTKPTT